VPSRSAEDPATDRITEKDARRGEQAAHSNPSANHIGFCAKGSQDGGLQSCCTTREEAVDEGESDDRADAPTRDPCECEDCGADCRGCVGVEQADLVRDETWSNSSNHAACVQDGQSIEGKILVDSGEGPSVLLDVEERDVEAQKSCERGQSEDIERSVAEGVKVEHLSRLL